uniref:uncharacterized protein taf1c n=1 Tax=Centroberyx gerrardi TaxID=166262 RepID=UPI003AB07F6B
MDFKFPQQLYPAFFNSGPPASVFKDSAGSWGGYEAVRPADTQRSGRLSSWTFASRHEVGAETWLPTEPVPLPLLSPKAAFPWPATPPDPLDFTQHMQNFFLDHQQDAFSCMSRVLGKNFHFRPGRKKKHERDAVHMWRVKDCMDRLKYKKCEFSYLSGALGSYGGLLSEVVHDVPPELLAGLLFDELTEQRERLLFSEAATGGALAFVPFARGEPQHGCLLYPGNPGLDRLNFHRVALQQQSGGPSCLDAGSDKPFSFQLRGPVRQISSACLLGVCCVAVRSDHLCGVWRFGETDEPRVLQVVRSREPACCVSVSPHVLGEVLVASESGAANLWTIGKGMQKFREEDGNLYFNAKSPWRWCEFSAHPRVMVYADRTGVELTDIRASSSVSHTLFRIGHTPACRSGERVILSRYLGDAHSFHHLITTQYSAYIMDERFPCMPMLKWDHMMKFPPMFAHILPGPASSSSVVGGANTTKVLLGSQSSQEITMLQYSGGRAEACVSRGPPQALLRPTDSLKHLPVQIPHRRDVAHNRLALPAAGLTCIHQRGGGGGGGGEECICVVQLTEAGDIFYQILEPQQAESDSTGPAGREEEPPQTGSSQASRPKEITTSERRTAERPSQPASPRLHLISDTSSEEDVIGPTQGATLRDFVAETQESERRSPTKSRTVVYSSDSSSEDSGLEGKRRSLKRLGLQVVVNDEPELDRTGLLDTRETNLTDNTEEAAAHQPVEENISGAGRSSRIDPSERRGPAKPSDGALVTWKRWLQKLMQKSRDNKPRPRHLQHRTVQTKQILGLSDGGGRDPGDEERLRGLRRDLRECMAKGSLPVHGATRLRPLETVPVPNPVDAEAWSDELSRRLTVSWQSDERWKSWWEERLGLNRDEKVEALRRKRRRQKEAKRAGRRLELSGSFTSSVSYQSEMDDFSDSTGWSSAASQGAWSDTEGFLSRLDVWSEPGTPRAVTPVPVTPVPLTPVPLTPGATPTATPTATPQKRHQQPAQRLQSPPGGSRSLSQTPRPDSTPAAILTQRKAKRPLADYLSSLFASQEPLQQQSYFLEEGSLDLEPPLAASSQLHAAQPGFHRSLRTEMSQDALPRMSLSQSLSFSQGSQGRPGPSQSSQPKKKKSRMGF